MQQMRCDLRAFSYDLMMVMVSDFVSSFFVLFCGVKGGLVLFTAWCLVVDGWCQ